MKILIDIGHPGHVHLLKNFYFEMKRKGHFIFVTVKDIPAAKELLLKYNIGFIDLGSKKDSLFGKAVSQLKYNFKIFSLVKKNNIEIGIGTSISIAHISKITKIKSIILDDDDDEVEPLFVRYVHPFCDAILSPSSLIGKRKSRKALFYDGFHELAYLHPNRFKPDENILKEVGLTKKDVFFIMRFNVFKAHHDVGINGLSLEQKLKLVEILENYGKVFITTEREIEHELKKYQFPVSSEKIHSLMSFATMFLGDSQTMTSEAAVLGVPAVKSNSFAHKLAVPNEIEDKYGLCYSFAPEEFNLMLDNIIELLNTLSIRKVWNTKKEKMLKDKIDVTAFLVWFVENYPKSKQIVKENPEFSNRFK